MQESLIIETITEALDTEVLEIAKQKLGRGEG